MRLLHVSLVFKSLGPKLVMMHEMIRDLIFFLIIIAIFVCSFGVITQANLYPTKNELNLNLIKNIIHKAYWPIYGEMKILEEDLTYCMSGDSGTNHGCSDENPNAISQDGFVFSFVALMVYMILANVLLINLLIAMFR